MKAYKIVSRDPGNPDEAELPIGQYLITISEDGTPFLAYRLNSMDRWGCPSKGVAAP